MHTRSTYLALLATTTKTFWFIFSRPIWGVLVDNSCTYSIKSPSNCNVFIYLFKKAKLVQSRTEKATVSNTAAHTSKAAKSSKKKRIFFAIWIRWSSKRWRWRWWWWWMRGRSMMAKKMKMKMAEKIFFFC